MTYLSRTLAAVCAIMAVGQAGAEPTREMVRPVSEEVGEMVAPMQIAGRPLAVDESLVFEPLQNFEEMFQRDDVVLLMRHGPTDWGKLDVTDVAPDDCENQRVLSDEGADQMRDFGVLLAANEIRPAKIVVSRWCRNQQTLERLRAGYEEAVPGGFDGIETETRDDLNLLLSLQGAPTVTVMRQMIEEWDGSDGDGPLLLISHFTNIQELTEFSVYEGEVLVLDPDRNNRVLGYFRLKSAGPDVGHFDVDASYD